MGKKHLKLYLKLNHISINIKIIVKLFKNNANFKQTNRLVQRAEGVKNIKVNILFNELRNDDSCHIKLPIN